MKPASPTPSLFRAWLAALLLAGGSLAAQTDTPADQNGASTDQVDLTPFRLEPDEPAEIALGFEAIDREIARLRQVNERRKGAAKAEASTRIEQIAAMRAELGRKFTKEGWDNLLLAVFTAQEANRLAATQFDDSTMWALSRNSAFLKAGHVTVLELCAPCHLPTLKGQSLEGFGPDLTDTVWLHGGRPTEIYDFISKGAFDRGMPPWASIIGAKKVVEVTAYVLSKHREGEPIHEHGILPPGGALATE